MGKMIRFKEAAFLDGVKLRESVVKGRAGRNSDYKRSEPCGKEKKRAFTQIWGGEANTTATSGPDLFPTRGPQEGRSDVMRRGA